MKNKLVYKSVLSIFLLSVISFSCRKVNYDYIEGKSPDERSREFMEDVRSTLIQAESGWVGYMYIPATKKGYTFYMQFKEGSRVSMYADFADTTARKSKESSFSVRNTGMPSLIFDTYNYIHLPADPNKEVSGGSDGTGQTTDFEYSILEVNEDSIILKGNLNGCDLILTKISQDELAKLASGSWKTTIQAFRDYFSANQNNYITLPDQRKMGLGLTTGTRQVSFQVLEDDESVTGYAGTFYFSINGLTFSNDFVYKGTAFTQAYIRDNTLYLVDGSGKEYEVKQNRTPLTPLAASFSYNGTYKKMHIEGQVLPAGVSSGWNQIYANMVNRFNNASGRVILSMDFVLQNANKARVVIIYKATSGTEYTADAEYDYEINGQVLTLSNYVPSISNNNWNTRIKEVGPEVVDYFKNASFKIDWAEGSGQEILGGLYPVDNPDDFFYGILQK